MAHPEGEEAQIEALVNNKNISSAGALFKLRILVLNSRVVLKAKERIDKIAREEKEKKDEKNRQKEEDKNLNAILCWNARVDKGKKIDKDGNPVLAKQQAVSIVKALLPRIAPREKQKNYNAMKLCTKWLGSLGSEESADRTWDAEMEVLEDEVNSFAAS